MRSTHIRGWASFAFPLFILLIALSIPLHGAENESKLAKDLRLEIENLERRIKAGEAGKRSAIDQLQDIDRKLELRRRLINELERNAAVSHKKVNTLGEQISVVSEELESLSTDLILAEHNLEKLRLEAAARMVYFYKRITGIRLALLSGVQEIHDLAIRRKYFASIEGFDRRSLERIQTQRNLIENDKKQRESLRQKLFTDQSKRLGELDRYRNLLQNKRQEETAQLEERKEKSTLLQNIENDNNLLRALLEERRQALEEIEREIMRQEQVVAKRPPSDFSPDTPFQQLMGRLAPPLKSLAVAQPYGPSRHPKLGTTTINPGVDLKARAGEQVSAVATGQVTRVAWLRGFGNTVIIAHGGGYYTVYSKLEQVFISEGQTVGTGQTLGQVADAGSDTQFHFEVWSKREKQDPMKWLKR